jgi:ubiquinone/menaquinone biosynthesis C-methylase UbiE
VLDVGCGQGIDLARFALSGATVTGIDLTPRHVSLARQHFDALGLSGSIVQGDAEDLPFGDESFDRVTSNGVLHHTPDFPASLREILRVLRPAGDARLILYHRDSVYYWLTQVLGHGVAQGRLLRDRSMSRVISRHEGGSRPGARPLVRVYSRQQLRGAMEQAGFTHVEVFVRHFVLEDTPFTKPLTRRGNLRNRQIGWIGDHFGWYVIGVGRRPPTSGHQA